MFSQVTCGGFSSQVDDVARLAKGQAVRIKGECSSVSSEKIDVTSARLTADQTGLAPAAGISAADHKPAVLDAAKLAAALADDKEAIDKRYHEREILVEGEVNDLEKGEYVTVLHLKGIEKDGRSFHVLCRGVKKTDLEQLAPGRRVRVKGKFSLGWINSIELEWPEVLPLPKSDQD